MRTAAYQGHCYQLAGRLRAIPRSAEPSVVAQIIAADLMRGPWWFQLLVGMVRLRGRVVERLTYVLTRHPDMAADIICATINHIKHGKDTEDRDSYGGFSQREFDLMVGILDGVVE